MALLRRRAQPSDPPYVQALHRAADRHVRALATAVMALAVKARPGEAEIERLVSEGRWADVEALPHFDPTTLVTKTVDLSAETGELASIYVELLRDGAMSDIGPGEAARLALRFDVSSPWVVRWAQTHAAQLVTSISEQSRLAIRTIITNAALNGGAPAVVARDIQQAIGLTERDARALASYRAGLEQAIVDGTKGELLRNRWALSTARGTIRAERIDPLVDRYAERLLQNRAMVIARTETLAAANQGQLGLWQQMAHQGMLDPGRTQRKWVTARDDRVCPICRPLNGQTIGFSGVFSTVHRNSLLTSETPPIHPSCRCTTVLVIAPPAS